jgi:hypothetical protein
MERRNPVFAHFQVVRSDTRKIFEHSRHVRSGAGIAVEAEHWQVRVLSGMIIPLCGLPGVTLAQFPPGVLSGAIHRLLCVGQVFGGGDDSPDRAGGFDFRLFAHARDNTGAIIWTNRKE